MIDALIGVPFGEAIRFCYELFGNYAVAIVMFTLLTKVILLPVSLWVQRNSIKMVQLMPELNKLKINYFGDKDTIAEETQALYKREHYHPLASIVPMVIQIVLLMGVIGAVNDLLGNSDSILTILPIQQGGTTLLMPVAAGLAALVLTLAQNKLNPLQREQSKAEQISTGTVSVAISLFLGAFVSLGTGIYWISSNLLSIPLQFVLNAMVNPKKYVDYNALDESRKELASISNLSVNVSREDKRREARDYKKFFSIANKHLVFYSEKSGFYKYYEDLISELLERSNIIIHYITSDPSDQVFGIAEKQSRIRPYYIGEKKLITLMMKMDADIVVMTTPDLESFHIKRSYVRKDIEYIYVNHGLGSINTELRSGALDHFDTIYLNNDQDKREIRAWEALKQLPPKRLVEYGYPLLDHLLIDYQSMLKRNERHVRKKVVIAPSWQPDNIMDSCIEPVLDHLLGNNYQLIVRPHPQYVRHSTVGLHMLEEKYRPHLDEVVFETEFSSFESIYSADLLITDWSGVGYEFSFTTCRPTLFIHTPMKIMNPEYEKIQIESFAERMRNRVGRDLPLEEVEQIAETVQNLLADADQYQKEIEQISREERYHFGHAAQVGAKDILTQLKNKRKSGFNT